MAVSTASRLEALSKHHDMALETRKRDGSWVSTAVNPLVEGDHVSFRTWSTSGKAKRLRNFDEVRFAPSTRSGKPTGPWLQGHATLLEEADAEHAASRINHKYPLLQGVAVRLFHRLKHYRTLHFRISDISAADEV